MTWYVSWNYVSSLGAFWFQACGIATNFVSFISKTCGFQQPREKWMKQDCMLGDISGSLNKSCANYRPLPLAAWSTKDWKCTREREGICMYGDDCTGIFVMGVCRENICRLYHMIHASKLFFGYIGFALAFPHPISVLFQGQIFCKPKPKPNVHLRRCQNGLSSFFCIIHLMF